jgi:hypothetical protein
MRHEAIYNTHPTVVSIDDTAGAFDAQGNQVAIDESLVAAEITRLEADYAAKKYQRGRAAAYPSLAEQMDMQYWDSVNGTTVWADTIAAIKAAHPKPEGQ